MSKRMPSEPDLREATLLFHHAGRKTKPISDHSTRVWEWRIRWRPANGPPATHRSEGVEEGDQLVLLRGGQRAIVVDDKCRFTGMAQDGFVAGQRFAVVHQPITRAHAPQRRGAHFVGGIGGAVLHHTVN